VLVGLLVEVFKFNSRVSSSELRGYKLYKPIEKDNMIRETRKIFKLPLPENVRGNGVIMSPMNEKKLSKVR